MSDQLPTFDPPKHTDHRALLMRLITPKRLSENEEFMWRLADRQLDEIVAAGHCEFISEFASPFAMLVVADLLGVPESDHAEFRAKLAAKGPKHRHRQHEEGAAAQSARVPLRAVHASTSRTARRNRPTTCSPGSPPRRSPTGHCPT